MADEQIQFELIAGLGNPGAEYEKSLHNAGFWYLDRLAQELSATFTSDKKAFSHVAKARLAGRTIYLVKPWNFMNNSGQGVAAVARFFKVPIEKVLVAHDEIDLPPGVVRVKQGGGHGGHNGLRDIIAKTGSKDFWRLRVGVGHPGHKNAVSGYVLKRVPADIERPVDEGLDVAIRQSLTLIDGDVKIATQNIHTHKPS